MLFLSDTPGIMVGPEAVKPAMVRDANRMLLTGANLDVPFFTIVLRKGYGIGVIAMGGGKFKEPLFLVSWPTGEFGGMGLEGQLKLGHRDELAAIEDPEERARVRGDGGAGLRARKRAEYGDDVRYRPGDRSCRVAHLGRRHPARRPPPPREDKKRPYIDAW